MTETIKFIRIKPLQDRDAANVMLETIYDILDKSGKEYKKSKTITNAKYKIAPNVETTPCFKTIEGITEDYAFKIEHILPQFQEQGRELYVSLRYIKGNYDNLDFQCTLDEVARLKYNIVADADRLIKQAFTCDQLSHEYKILRRPLTRAEQIKQQIRSWFSSGKAK